MKRVFLGGTCNGSQWRDAVVPFLKIESFNPVVENWTPECQEEELRQRESCDFCLYVITPRMTGVYSIAEVADDSNKRPTKTVFCFMDHDSSTEGGIVEFTQVQLKSLKAVGVLVEANGGKWCKDLNEVVEYLNAQQ